MQRTVMGAIAFGALALAGCLRASDVPIAFFGDRIMPEHKISGTENVVGPQGEASFSDIHVFADVDSTGRVTRAWSEPNPVDGKLDKRPAIAAALTWRFRPFTFQGKAVSARVSIPVGYRAEELWADRPIPFPKLPDRDFAITLRRSACFGNCPDYQVTIAGDGTVTFVSDYTPINPVSGLFRQHSQGGIIVPGRHVTHISTVEVDALVERFRRSTFFAAKPSYSYNATDSPTYALRMSWGRHHFEVTDYIGLQAGMPMAIHDLEKDVDRVAGTDRWITGTADTVEILTAEGFDFTSVGARALLSDASANADPASRAFAVNLARHVPLGEPVGPDRMPLGTAIALNAAWTGNRALFVLMRDQGWAKHLPKAALSKAFANSLGGCDASFARALVEAGADPNAPDGDRTVFQTVDSLYGACEGKSSAERIAFAKALIALGSDVNARNGDGQTAIFDVEDADLAHLLIDSGVRLDIRDKEGTLPILASWYDSVVLTMLEAGAQLAATDKDREGRTLRLRTSAMNMPGAFAWLVAHHIP